MNVIRAWPQAGRKRSGYPLLLHGAAVDITSYITQLTPYMCLRLAEYPLLSLTRCRTLQSFILYTILSITQPKTGLCKYKKPQRMLRLSKNHIQQQKSISYPFVESFIGFFVLCIVLCIVLWCVVVVSDFIFPVWAKLAEAITTVAARSANIFFIMINY